MDNVLGLGFFVWLVAAWLTHVFVSISSAKWILLLVGAIFFPIGCVHGTGIWFGFF